MNADGGDRVAVEVRDLVKEFKAPGGGKLVAVNGISFKVYEGEVFGFLGPNGAGKTTTLEIIEGLRAPTSGHTTVLGMDSQKNAVEMKSRIGVQLQSGAYFAELRLEEILDLFGSFYPKRLAPLHFWIRVKGRKMKKRGKMGIGREKNWNRRGF